MKQIISEIKALELQKFRLKEEFDKQMEILNSSINNLKLSLADLVLYENKETEQNAFLIGIEFKENGKVYDYIWDEDEEIEIGDYVYVESKWNGFTKVKVVSKRNLHDNENNGLEYKNAYPLEED